MAGKSGTQEWFYHAPKKRSPNAPAKDYPAPSQIPMLSNAIIEDDIRDESGTMRGWIRESDSKYVKLAKMRGRKDLLQIRERTPPAAEAKPYPRVDWFDHNPEDVPQDNAPRKVYLPDYMVHEEYNPESHVDDQQGTRPPPRRPPFSLQDKLSVFQREGDAISDKMHVKLPELIKPAGKKIAKKDKGKKEESKQKSQSRAAKKTHLENKERPIMGKLLNFGYQQEWYDHQKKLQTQQPSWGNTGDQGNRLTTEYRDEINTTTKGYQQTKDSSGPKKVQTTKKMEASKKTRQVAEDKDLFKLSKFDKVGARISSHWSAGPRLNDQQKLDTYTQQLDEMARA